MFSCSHRAVPAVVVALAVALPAGSAAAQPADLRSPDTREAAVVLAGPQDLRSPDARVGAVPATTAVKVDLRSPDAVDGATGSRRGIDVAPSIVRVSAPVVDGGFQWGDAGIGAGILVGLLILSAGGYAMTVAHRRSAGGAPVAH